MEIEARIAVIQEETPTIKSFLLDLMGQSFPFYPGQYVDLILETPSSYETGGYYITSSPKLQSFIQVAIRKMPNRAVSLYLHERSQVGDEVFIMGPSGDFYFEEGMANSLVLIAGGLGITSVVSTIRYVHEAGLDVPVTLLYSARTPSELLFHKELADISTNNPKIKCLFTVTRPGDEAWDGRAGRIDPDLLKEHVTDKDAMFYLNGPRGMSEDMAMMLTSMGVDPSRLNVEQW